MYGMIEAGLSQDFSLPSKSLNYYLPSCSLRLALCRFSLDLVCEFQRRGNSGPTNSRQYTVNNFKTYKKM